MGVISTLLSRTLSKGKAPLTKVKGLSDVLENKDMVSLPKERPRLSEILEEKLKSDRQDDLGFYSPTGELAKTLDERGTGVDFLNILNKGDGKGSRIQEEITDMGLDTFLKGKGKVTRGEVEDYIKANKLEYEKTTLRNATPEEIEEVENTIGEVARRKQDLIDKVKEAEDTLIFNSIKSKSPDIPEIQNATSLKEVHQLLNRKVSMFEDNIVKQGWNWGGPRWGGDVAKPTDPSKIWDNVKYHAEVKKHSDAFYHKQEVQGALRKERSKVDLILQGDSSSLEHLEGYDDLFYGKRALRATEHEFKELRKKSKGNAKYEDWSLGGGKDYNESLLKPKGKYATEYDAPHYEEFSKNLNLTTRNAKYKVMSPEGVAWFKNDAELWAEVEKHKGGGHLPNQTPAGKKAYDKWVAHRESIPDNFESDLKVHLMDELQSDLHQQGRKEGYIKEVPNDIKKEAAKLNSEAVETEAAFNEEEWKLFLKEKDEFIKQDDHFNEHSPLTEVYSIWEAALDPDSFDPALRTLWDKMDKARTEAWNFQKKHNINEDIDPAFIVYRDTPEGSIYGDPSPDSPAKNSWMNQGIKMDLMKAIKDGDDYFAWTPGEVHGKRYPGSEGGIYSISDPEVIRYDTEGAGVIDNFTEWGVTYKDAEGAKKFLEFNTTKDIQSFFGKKIMDDMFNKDLIDDMPVNTTSKLEGDFEIGGEGMKNFYDRDVKKRVEKIIKGLDKEAKVEVITLGNGVDVWAVKITPAMKKEVEEGGLPLYSAAPAIPLTGAALDKDE